MSTNAAVGYVRDGKYRATYIHWDGYPSNIIPTISDRIAANGMDWFIQWVEKGIAETGYREVSGDETFNDDGEYLIEGPLDSSLLHYRVTEDMEVQFYRSSQGEWVVLTSEEIKEY